MVSLSQTELDDLVHLTHKAEAATWPFAGISTALFGLRMFTRFYMNRTPLGWDDFTMTFGWILDVVGEAIFQKGYYVTRNIDLNNLHDTLPPAYFWLTLGTFWSYICISLPKMSVGMLLINIFKPRRWIKYGIIGLCALLMVVSVVGFITSFVQCDPVQAIWEYYRLRSSRCWYPEVFIVYNCAFAGISAVIDFAFAIYPASVIYSLQMSKNKKAGATTLLSLGIASGAFAIIKLVYTTHFWGDGIYVPYKRLYTTIFLSIWNTLEADFVLSAACLPSTPPFFKAGYSTFHGYYRSYSVSRRPSEPFRRSLRLGSNEDVRHAEPQPAVLTPRWDERILPRIPVSEISIGSDWVPTPRFRMSGHFDPPDL